MPVSQLTTSISELVSKTLENAATVADAYAEEQGKLAKTYVRSGSLFAQYSQGKLVAEQIAVIIRSMKEPPSGDKPA